MTHLLHTSERLPQKPNHEDVDFFIKLSIGSQCVRNFRPGVQRARLRAVILFGDPAATFANGTQPRAGCELPPRFR